MRITLATLHSKYIHASLALPYLASYCRDTAHPFTLVEFTLQEPKETILATLLAERPDIVAFSVYLWNRHAVFELVDALTIAAPALKIVLGGPEMIAAEPSVFYRHPGLFAIIRGEGEAPFRGLLNALAREESPGNVPGLLWRRVETVIDNGEAAPLADLDSIPSPFAAGWVDLGRGLVYYESSRGCPYRCAFCMSARDPRVRSFSMERIKSDLDLLMQHKVGIIKFVDRTFNYDAPRARAIWRHLLEKSQGSRFHFEIGAHLLTEEDLELLAEVPKGVFQFEIGVQSTLPATLSAIGRHAPLERLEANVRRLREADNIPLHLDLIAGLPGEGYDAFLASINRVAALRPHHLQIETVKLLPGAPLRDEAEKHGIAFDPNPPYTALRTADLSFDALQQLRGMSRVLDLTLNSHRLENFIARLSELCGGLAEALAALTTGWEAAGLLRHPQSQQSLFEAAATFAKETFPPEIASRLAEEAARDFALCERIPLNRPSPLFDTALTPDEEAEVRQRVRQRSLPSKKSGAKLQHFVARFHHLAANGPRLHLFFYLNRPHQGMEVEEVILPPLPKEI